MQFVSHRDEQDPQALLARALRVSRATDGAFIDAWLTDGPAIEETHERGLVVRRGDEGVCVSATRVVSPPTRDRLAELTQELFASLFAFADAHQLHLVRAWSQLPLAVPDARHAFARGRRAAFIDRYGAPPPREVVPAASELGVPGATLTVELFASAEAPRQLEIKDVPARELSARGSLLAHRGQRLLFAAAASGVRDGAGDLRRELRAAVQSLRVLVSQFNLKPHGVEFGFGLEDLVSLRVAHRRAGDRAQLARLLPRYLDPDCHLAFVDGEPGDPEALVELEGVFLKKGEYLDGSRKKYYLSDGKIRVGSLEVHVAEHCNLRCRGCDAMSPFNDPRFLSVDEVARVCATLAPIMRADIFKLMGGEPLLHPEIVALLETVRASGIARVLRLTTNGLLLRRMPDAFFAALDRLTVSNYASAPIPPEHLAWIEAQTEAHDVVLNLKWIDQFNEIELTEPLANAQQIQQNYDDCWIRHRSLIVRDGIFYKCTRAAYLDDFRARLRLPVVDGDPASYREADGIPLDAPDFAARALAYLNAPEPLASCRYCLGAAGRLQPHVQYDRRQVARMLGRA